MISTKAQIQLGESIFVVMIIIVLLVFGIVFYSQVEKDDLNTELQSFTDLDTITITQYATSLTELQCSLQEVQYPNCFDITKINAFTSLIRSTGEETAKEFYFSQLGNAKVTITQIYPTSLILVPNEEYTWLIYENKPETDLANVKQAQVNIPINLYDPIRDTSAFGILTIIQYQ